MYRHVEKAFGVYELARRISFELHAVDGSSEQAHFDRRPRESSRRRCRDRRLTLDEKLYAVDPALGVGGKQESLEHGLVGAREAEDEVARRVAALENLDAPEPRNGLRRHLESTRRGQEVLLE